MLIHVHVYMQWSNIIGRANNEGGAAREKKELREADIWGKRNIQMATHVHIHIHRDRQR